jgi:hypothetical protein
MTRDERASAEDPGGHSGTALTSSAGWLNPDHQLVGQVTSRVRRLRLYDHLIGGLTHTEEARIRWKAASSGSGCCRG